MFLTITENTKSFYTLDAWKWPYDFLPEASFGLRVLSLLRVCVCVSVNHELVQFKSVLPNLDQKRHLSTVKVPVDFLLNLIFSFIFNLKAVVSTKLCVFYSFCVGLYIFSETIANECSTFHMAPHIYIIYIRILMCTRTGSRHGPWNSLVLYLGGTIGAQWAVDSAIGTGFYKLLSVFAKLYTPHMPQFYMPTFGNHRNNNKIAPISLYLVRLPLGVHWESPGIVGIKHTRHRHGNTSLFHNLTTGSFVHIYKSCL